MLLDRFHRKFYHSRQKNSENAPSQDDSMTDPNEDVLMDDDVEQPIPMSVCGSGYPGYQGESGDMIYVDPSVQTPLATTPVGYGGRQEMTDGLTGPFPPYLQMQGRQNSASSLASSISDFHGGLRQQAFANAAVSGSGNFTPQFMALLTEVYQAVCSDPTVTPFDTTNPPSAILNKTAKIALEECKIRDVEIGCERNSWLLTLVRRRLLDEVRKDGYLSRSNSNVSLPPPPPQFMEMMYSTSFQSSKPSTPDCSAKGAGPQEYFGNMLSANPANNRTGLMRSRSNSSQVLLARTRSNSNGLFALTPTSSETGLAPGFNGAGLSLNTNHANLLSRQRSNTATGSPATTPITTCWNPSPIDDSAASEVSRKKRDALRLKR